VPWLKFSLDKSWSWAIHWGMTVFLAGEVIKVLLSGLLLPGAWRLRRKLEQ
jgi:biotin transport system substrate-specific component